MTPSILKRGKYGKYEGSCIVILPILTREPWGGFMLLLEGEQSRVIEMAWDDRIPFKVIEEQCDMIESAVIKFMRRSLKPRIFRLWRERVNGRSTKHIKLRSGDVTRGHCPSQYKQR